MTASPTSISVYRAVLGGAATLLAALASGPLGAQQKSTLPTVAYGPSDSVIVGHVTGRWYDIDVVNRHLFGAGNAIIDIDQLRIVAHIADSTPGTEYFVAAEDERGLTNSGVVFNPTTGAVGEHMPIHGDGIAYDPISRRALLLGDTIQLVNLAPSIQGFPMMQRRMGQGGGMGGGMGSPTSMNQDPKRDTVIRRLPPVRLTATIVGEIPLSAAAVSGVADGNGHVYVAVPGRDSVMKIDGMKARLIGGRAVAPFKAPTALAIDNIHQRLFVGCDSGVVVLSLTDGHVSGQVATGGHPTQMAFDPGSGLLFVPAGDRGMVVIHEDNPERYSVVQTITDPRVLGATAVVFDPTTHRAFVPHTDADGTFRFTILEPQF
jgi:hypothetical protein